MTSLKQTLSTNLAVLPLTSNPIASPHSHCNLVYRARLLIRVCSCLHATPFLLFWLGVSDRSRCHQRNYHDFILRPMSIDCVTTPVSTLRMMLPVPLSVQWGHYLIFTTSVFRGLQNPPSSALPPLSFYILFSSYIFHHSPFISYTIPHCTRITNNGKSIVCISFIIMSSGNVRLQVSLFPALTSQSHFHTRPHFCTQTQTHPHAHIHTQTHHRHSYAAPLKHCSWCIPAIKCLLARAN